MTAIKQATKEPKEPSQEVAMLADKLPPAVRAEYDAIQSQPLPLPVYSPRIASALSDIMGEIGGVVKGGENKFHNYKYQRIEDILTKVTPLLAKHGITIVQSEVGRALFDNDGVVSVSYSFTIIHKSGDVWPDRPVQTGMSRARDSKGGFDDKSFNKCHTAARKFFLKSLFMITDTETPDNDGEENYTKPERAKPGTYSRKVQEPTDMAINDELPEHSAPPKTEIPFPGDALLDVARSKSLYGTVALEEFWHGLPKADQKALLPHKEALKDAATKADSHRPT